MSALLKEVLRVIQTEFRQDPPEWKDKKRLHPSHDALLEKECQQPSPFDPHHTRLEMWKEWKKGNREAVLRECDYGQILVVLDTGMSADQIPWELWGRILRLYSSGKRFNDFQIYIIAVNRPRRFPDSLKTPIGPEHINGGYTYPCKKDAILIYRAEDATRVLIHELQHASCLDHPEDGVDRVEAETEAWAELCYVALLSGGNDRVFQNGIRHQSAWMQAQNRRVRQWIGETNAFPWRYTVGKEEVWRRWGIFNPSPLRLPEARHSLRLTIPSDSIFL